MELKKLFRPTFLEIQDRNIRFIIPVIINIAVKFLMFLWVQLSINNRPELFSYRSWLEMFTIWDGGWYNLIARYWYEDIPMDPPIPIEQLFAFPPGFPALIRALGFLVGDFLISQAVIALFFGIVWIPLFQLVAEEYLSQEESFSATLIASLFPIVFIFTTVGYSEGLFLTLILSSWLLYLRNKHLSASILAAGASLVRWLGSLIVAPFIIESVIQKQFGRALIYTLPVLSQITWFYYGYLRTGNIFIVFEAQKYWKNRLFWSQFAEPALFQKNPPFSFNLPYTESFMGLALCLLAIFILFAAKVYEIDWKLGAYFTLTLIFIIYSGSIISYPRFLSFIFPLWFLFRMKRDWRLIPTSLTLGFLNLITGYLFARWVFLG